MNPNAVVFVVIYLLLMVPTYVLPYLGSNSSIVNAVSAGVGLGMTPQWWAHVWSLSMLCLLSWARGGVIGRAWLPTFPILASFFDLTPLLSSIPLVPTLLHLGGLLSGVIGTSFSQDENAASHQAALNRKVIKGALVATLCAIGGATLFQIAAKNILKTNVVPATAPAASTPSLPKPTQSDTVESAPSQISPRPAAVEQSDRKDQHPPVKRTTKPNEDGKPKPAVNGTTTRYINLND